MNKIEEYISELLPPELQTAKALIDALLPVEINDRLTNIKYLEKKKKIYCPINEKHHIKKNGTKNGVQRYYCHDCKSSFSITNNSIANHSSLNYNQFKTLLKCMYDYKPLNEMAKEVQISETSTFEMGIRIFKSLEIIQKDVKLSEVIQCDEKYVRTSFKGFRKGNMPRPSRHSGHQNLIAGISKDQVCIVVAIDSNDNLVIKVVDVGNATGDMITEALTSKIKEGSILVTDAKNSYDDFATQNKLKLIKIPTGQHGVGNYTINDVNEIMTEIENYLRNKRGISSRHLQHHMNFIRYRKIIKYTIEYLEINEAMYQDMIVKLNIDLKSNDVYSTELPFSISEYKEWYNSRI